MALNKYTDSGLSPRVNVYAERKMLSHAEPVMVLEKVMMPVQMPKNRSQTIKFRRPIPFTAQTSPLAEGVTPTSTSFSYEDVTATLQQYGQIAEITDVIEDTHEDPVLNDIVMMLGENVGRTKEALNYGVVRAGTNVFYGNGSARTDVNTPITLTKQRAVVRALKAQKAKMISSMLSPSVNYGTKGIEAGYVAVAHTNLESDIREMPGFIPVVDYGQRSPMCAEEIGSVEGVRYILSPDLEAFADAGSTTLNGMLSNGGTQTDVYPVLYFGREAAASVALRGAGAITPTIIPVGQKTKDDPLGQRGVAGWKMWHAALILNQLWMARLEVCATDIL